MRGRLVYDLLVQTIGDSRAQDAILEVFDTLFAGLIVGPLVMIYWQSAWNLMNLYILPNQPIWSALITAFCGLCAGLLLCVFQDNFNRKLTPKIGWSFYVLTRLFTYIAGVVNISACRGVWNLLDNTIVDPDVTLLSTVVATLILLSLRGVRNSISAPYCIVVDSSEGYFDAPTFYKQSSRETVLYILDCIFSVAVVGSLVVFVWRGSWALLDIYFYPEDLAKSCWTSLIVGYAMVMFTFALQAPMRWLVAKLQGAPRLILADAYHVVSFIATVNVWRGLWGLLDIYLYPDAPYFSNWCSHIVSLGLLIVLNCSNSVLVRGVYIDADEPNGDCVVFPCHYLRLFFQKEKTKKRHRGSIVISTGSAIRRMEEARVPLQIPEEKV